MANMEMTLCLLKKDGKILLARKIRDFGKDKYNGIGGKIKEGETPEETMIRECSEEIKVTPTTYDKVGHIVFDEYYKGEKTNVTMHLYIATQWDGIISESDEMADPKWFSPNEIPYNDMFPDDRYWLPPILDGQKIKAYFEFDEDWNLISKRIEPLQ